MYHAGWSKYLTQRVEAQKPLTVHLEQAIQGSLDRDLALSHLLTEFRARPAYGPGQGQGSLIFVHIVRADFKGVNILLAQATEMLYILGPHDMPFAKGGAFKAAWDNFGDVMG